MMVGISYVRDYFMIKERVVKTCIMVEEYPLVNFEKEDVAVSREVFIEVVKETSRITFPMRVVNVSQYGLHVS